MHRLPRHPALQLSPQRPDGRAEGRVAPRDDREPPADPLVVREERRRAEAGHLDMVRDRDGVVPLVPRHGRQNLRVRGEMEAKGYAEDVRVWRGVCGSARPDGLREVYELPAVCRSDAFAGM